MTIPTALAALAVVAADALVAAGFIPDASALFVDDPDAVGPSGDETDFLTWAALTRGDTATVRQILGRPEKRYVVEHRARADVPADDKSGYVGEAQVIAMAEAAGFKLVEKSEVNANPRDTKDHPNGVWTLPPGNNHDAADNAKYKAIGESDRMTLRFVKPAK